MVTLGPLLRLRRKKQQRTMRFNQRMTLRKFQVDQEGDQQETKLPTLSFTNGHWHSVQTRKSVTTLLSMMAWREFSELISSPSKCMCICSVFVIQMQAGWIRYVQCMSPVTLHFCSDIAWHYIFAVGSDISILRAPMAAAISPFMSSQNPPNPWSVMM